MSASVQRTPKSGRQSLFFQDLATPVSSRRGRFSSPGQTAAVSALWRDNFAASDLPPPPCFTLEDRSEISPEYGISDYPISPELKSDPRTPPAGSSSKDVLTPVKSISDASTSYAMTSNHLGSASSGWWSSNSGMETDYKGKGKGSPVEGVVRPCGLVTLPPPQEVARPEFQKTTSPLGNLNEEEEWVTVFGFMPGDTNMILREFEKCGVILRHVPGPRSANWVHILYQNRSDSSKALSKNGMRVNGVLLIGVKPLDPLQRIEVRSQQGGFMTSIPPQSTPIRSANAELISLRPSSQYLQSESNVARKSGGAAVAIPAKSLASKVLDLMFGM